MRIFLTGSSGFLGGALARHWIACGHELWILARPTSCLDRLVNLPASVRVLRTSFLEEIEAAVRMADPDVIVHTACSYGRKGETPLDLMDVNMRLGTVLMQSVLDKPACNERPTTFINTGTVLGSDVSLYALSKNQFSAWGGLLAAQAPEKLRFIDVKLQQMYGIGDDRSKLTTHVIEACCNNELRLALTQGEQIRDFIHINDVVLAYDSILEHHGDFATSDKIEVGSGEGVTLRSFVELTKKLAGASTLLDFGAVPYRANEAMLCVADTTRLRSLNWRPKVPLVNGIKNTIDALRFSDE
jgi:CDP-paratose synthetase